MIKFAELKQYISRTARISICFRDGNYDNYTMISDIPDGKYDSMYVYGIGTADVEFPLDVYKRPSVDFAGDGLMGKGYYLGCGLEIVLQDEPRYSTRENEQLLSFCDLRSYLQLGMNFSVVKKEDWTDEQFVWRDEIPKEYDIFYVYGIGLEDISEEFKEAQYAEMKIGCTKLAKQMVIVLAKTPREDIEESE